MDTRETHNFVTKATTKRLELKLASTYSHVKTVNVETQNAHGVAKGVAIKLGIWKSTTNFTATTMDILDTIIFWSILISNISWSWS